LIADPRDRRGALALSRLCLDTSAYSRFKRGDPQAVELIDGADWLGMPAIVLGELEVGFLAGERAGRNEEELAVFLDNPLSPCSRSTARPPTHTLRS
jgi:predicted nucleic acid-binding protein